MKASWRVTENNILEPLAVMNGLQMIFYPDSSRIRRDITERQVVPGSGANFQSRSCLSFSPI